MTRSHGILASVLITSAVVLLVMKFHNWLFNPIDSMTGKVYYSVVQVESDLRNSSGTAFAVTAKSGKLFLVTNDHVCAQSLSSTMWAHYEEVMYPAKIVERYGAHDLCLLSVAGDHPLKPLKIADEEPYIDDVVFSAGFPMIPYLTVMEGRYKGPIDFTLVVDIPEKKCKGLKYKKIKAVIPELPSLDLGSKCYMEGYAIATTVHADFGSSGSPLLNEAGEVVGVVFLTRGAVALAAAVPLSYLQDLLSKH